MSFYCVAGSRVDVSRLFSLFSFDVIMRSALSLESEFQTNPDPELLQKVLTVFHVPLYIHALSVFPFWQRVKKFFDINPIQHVRYFEKLSRKVLEIRKKSPSGRRDLFQLMLEAKEESVNGTGGLTDEEIIAQTKGNVPVKSKLQHPPPGAYTGHLTPFPAQEGENLITTHRG